MQWTRQGRTIPLASLEPPPDEDKGSWQFTDFFARVDVCYQWHQRPSQFGLCEPAEDFGVMMAYTRATTRMQAWTDHIQAEELEKQRRESERHG